MITKAALRKEMKQRLESLPPQQFHEEGLQLASRIRSLPLWSAQETLLFYLSMNLEIDTEPLLERAFLDKKRVFVPKVAGEDLHFFRIYTLSGPWHYGAFSIREPQTDKPEDLLKPEDFPALIIVPGVAFTKAGERMGHGRGYYDRFFESLDKQGVSYATLGICMEAQIVPEVPTEPWDKKMDALCFGGNSQPL
ncbi:MAG: 5-formyltetrahydrofolate cyclo-ligase [Treponema sp.]|jgi:5-formyltetrahydrofolate cyclo-ligase|nr:5-formyltetrahydrofolate cyclo-ligase [Treponema sp.]